MKLHAARLGVLALALSMVVACGSDPCTQCPSAAGTGAAGGTGGTGGTPGTGRDGPCESDAVCDTSHGFSCTLGQCRYACSSHFDCEGQGTCQALADDTGAKLGNYCSFFEEVPPPGQYYTRCPTGTECDPSFSCLGAGEGDADAYCSAACSSDADCPTGFMCDEISDSEGNLHEVCIRRRFCAPCETDTDCLTVPNQVCAKGAQGDEKTCTELCDPEIDSCPWGNAAVCGLFDEELGRYTCAHRFGSCHGDGKSCEPCVRDSDCPLGFCNGSSYTSERWCVDTTIDCNCDGLSTTQSICDNGNGCPQTPGGLQMMCFGDSRGEGDPYAYACFAATTSASSGSGGDPQTGCWGPL